MSDDPHGGDNPYAPPAGDGSARGAPEGGRGLRIAGGVVLILLCLWSGFGGGCTIIAGTVASEADEYRGPVSDALEGDGQRKLVKKMLYDVFRQARGLQISGVMILLAGALCLVAAIDLLRGKVRWPCYAAPTVGVVAELLFFALVAFNVFGLVKLAFYGFCGFCAAQGRVTPAEQTGARSTDS